VKRLFLAALLVGTAARADTSDTFLTVGYVAPVALGGIATAANGVALAYDQPSSRGWRILGITTGAIDLGIGVAVFATNGDKTAGVVLGSVAVAVGGAALLTGLFAREDSISVGVIHVAGGGGVSLRGRF
jgi:hypothetical protein